MNITAIVVARGGSRRLPNKALQIIAGMTLIAHKVRQLRLVPEVTSIVVGSDSDNILLEAARAGATPYKRDEYHCDEDRCTANEMIRDMASAVAGEIIMWAHPTNPLVTPVTYSRAIRTYIDCGSSWDSLCSVFTSQRHAWYCGKPLNFEPQAIRHRPAAELQAVQFQDGAIFIQPRKQMIGNRYFYGLRPWLFDMPAPQSLDIDTEADLIDARRIIAGGFNALATT